MKLWALIKTDNRTVSDKVFEFDLPIPGDAAGWHSVIKEITGDFDLSCPILLKKHVQDLAHFNRVTFKADDFIESVDFDKFEIEILREKKKK